MIKKRSLAAFILLSLITCGIYGIVFMWGYVNDINRVCVGDGQESPNYIIVLLLSMITCGIYGMYWLYKQGDRLQNIAPKYGLSFQEGGTTVLLWSLLGAFIVVGPYVAMYILIKNLNAVGDVYNANMFNNYNQPQQ